ncbi:MAG: DUF4280 domain-containing protein [Holosporales bacterium]|nr:DUF4280 domain-containing protein [Holosporales bacterium]
MPIAVCGALCKCSCGATPSSLVVIPRSAVFACGMPVASIMDFVPMINVISFGMCMTIANPVVASATAAATAAALGVFTFTPMPCVPSISTPWVPTKPNVLLSTGPVVSGGDVCMCMWGGSISVTIPGQFSVL